MPFASNFTTGAVATPDVTSPFVEVVTPAAGATDVPVNSSILLQFNEPLDPTTVNSSTILIRLNESPFSTIDGTYTLSGSLVTFQPTSVRRSMVIDDLPGPGEEDASVRTRQLTLAAR